MFGVSSNVNGGDSIQPDGRVLGEEIKYIIKYGICTPHIYFIYFWLFIYKPDIGRQKTYSSLFRESNSITYKIISKKYVYFP